MCQEIEVRIDEHTNCLDETAVDSIVHSHTVDLSAKLDRLTELILKLNGFDPYTRNRKDLRFKVRKDIELIADEFSLSLNNPKS